MKKYNPKDHPEYFESFDDSAWKEIEDNLENLSFEEFKEILEKDGQRCLEEYKKRNMK